MDDKPSNLPTFKPSNEAVRRIVVIGMGYVGIPCAALLADVPGFRVTGVQRRSKRSGWKIECLNSGNSPFAGDEPGLPELIHRVAVEKGTFHVTDDYAVCEKADVILIDVQTPTDEHHVPRYESLREVSERVGRHLQPDTLVIIESTVAPGTTQNVVQPILERESGLKASSVPTFQRSNAQTRFFLAFSYERVMPGKLLAYITDFPRVVGGIDEESARRAVALYETIVNEEVSATDVLTAEMSKVIENAYRDVNIAFANEMALACERMGVDAFEIRGLINARPDRNVHRPGAGVGGHCLPKDSWLLAHGVEVYGRGAEVLRLIPLAREINDGMPGHMLELIEGALGEAGRALPGATVALLGVAYLENADDTRNTPAADLAALLLARGAEVVAHDPHVRVAEWERALDDALDVPLTKHLDQALADADCAVVVTGHREYANLSAGQLRRAMRTPVMVDGRNVLPWADGGASGVVVRAIGKGWTGERRDGIGCRSSASAPYGSRSDSGGRH
jgi:UDP-N-acetyl-D-mannosaminuronic acid dehydrogenase